MLLPIIGLAAGLVPAAMALRFCQLRLRYQRAMRQSAALDRRMEEQP